MIQTRKALVNNYSFKDAFTTYFIYAIIGIAISVVFNIILFNFIDPSAKETVKELSIEAAVEWMKKFNTPTSAIKEAVEQTGKVLILHEDNLVGGIGGEISAWISEHCFELLDAPVLRCASLDTPIPFNIELEKNLETLYQFIHDLKEVDKAMMLLYLDEKSYREIAEIMGHTETNVATKISRIKKSLQNKFLLIKKQ